MAFVAACLCRMLRWRAGSGGWSGRRRRRSAGAGCTTRPRSGEGAAASCLPAHRQPPSRRSQSLQAWQPRVEVRSGPTLGGRMQALTCPPGCSWHDARTTTVGVCCADACPAGPDAAGPGSSGGWRAGRLAQVILRAPGVGPHRCGPLALCAAQAAGGALAAAALLHCACG